MKPRLLPFNVELLKLTPQRLAGLKPVLSLDIYEGASSNFHEDGLWSVSIFGRVGDEARDTRFSYINIKAEIFHPVIYDRLIRLKGMYQGIMMGRTYALWSDEESDFIAADELTGETGYHFFMTHWKKIKFKTSKSAQRMNRIALIEKYRERATVNQVLVLPAGLRDIEVDENGRVSQDEINEIYKRIISVSNTLSSAVVGINSQVLNVPRYQLQMAFNEVYALLERMITGKGGFIQSKWGSRKIYNGTRNVISAMDTSTKYLGGANSPKFNDTILGVYQTIKGALPLTIHLLLNGWLKNVFGNTDGKARLVDKRTLRSEYVGVPFDVVDRWTKTEGLTKVIDSYVQVPLRQRPIDIEGYWLGLIYIGPSKTGAPSFRIFGDITELPEWASKDNVHPLNLCQLIYLSGYQRWNTLGCCVTRYPITGIGSIYPSKVYVKTTMVGEVRTELGRDWELLDETTHTALEFPQLGSDVHVDSQIPHPSRLAGLGADFDGDTASANLLYSDEAVAEIDRYLSTKEAYLDPRGGLKASSNVNTIALVLRNMTGD